MKGKSLWRASFVLAIILVLLGIIVPPALATVPQQAKGAHSSSGSGNCRFENDPNWRDLTNVRILPEGYTGYTSNWISVLNLHSSAQTATIRCRDEFGSPWTAYLGMSALGGINDRRSINLNTFVPSGKSVSTVVSVPNGRVMAERSTYKGNEGTCSSGSGSPRSAVYLAEGYTGHDVWISVGNNDSSTRRFYFSLRTGSGQVAMPYIDVPRYARGSLHVNDFVSGAQAVSTIVYAGGNYTCVNAERSSYYGTVATSSKGTWSPWIIGQWQNWYAEGYSNFQHYIAFLNLGPLPGKWWVEFRSNGGTGADNKTIPGGSRGTFEETCFGPGVNYASVTLAQSDPPPGGTEQDYASERSSYYGPWGTSSEGVNFLAERNWFYFAEGYTGHDVYIAIYNPYATTTMRFIFYIEGVSGKQSHNITVGSGKVAVVHVNGLSWAKTYPNHGFAFEVSSSSGRPFAVERSSYFN